MLVQAVGVVNVWLPSRCRWLGIFWCKTICSFDCDMVLSHLPLWLLCCIGSDILKVVNVDLLCADGLAYSDARPSSALSLMWCQAIYSLCYKCYMVRSVVVVGIWQPEWCRWLGIFWCKAICNSEFDVVPSHLQSLTVECSTLARSVEVCDCLVAWSVQMAWPIHIWYKAICRSELNVVPSHLQPFTV